jgi:hypothetical protein
VAALKEQEKTESAVARAGKEEDLARSQAKALLDLASTLRPRAAVRIFF